MRRDLNNTGLQRVKRAKAQAQAEEQRLMDEFTMAVMTGMQAHFGTMEWSPEDFSVQAHKVAKLMMAARGKC